MKNDFLTKVLGCSTNRVDLQNCSVLLCQPYCEIQRNIRKIWNNRFLFSLTDKSWEEMLQIPTPVQKAQEVTFQQDIQHYKLFIAQNNFSSLFWKYSRFAVSRFFQFNNILHSYWMLQNNKILSWILKNVQMPEQSECYYLFSVGELHQGSFHIYPKMTN